MSLVVCLHREKDFLARLLDGSAGLYDDLVVVHDGPEDENSESVSKPASFDPIATDFATLRPDSPLPIGYLEPAGPPQAGSIHELVVQHHGRFFEGPRCFQQEPHWPFAWSRAQHDWILRLDADECPSEELKVWLRAFRSDSEPAHDVSGYTCIWPLWNGRCTITKRWPPGRLFLFHKQRVRFFGMVEHVPTPDETTEPLPLILEHKPTRKSYGLRNLVLRPQAYSWRRVIAESLLKKPADLPCWRCLGEEWPQVWEDIRSRPLRTALYRLAIWPLLIMRDMLRVEGRIILAAAIPGGVHHCLIALNYWRLRRFTKEA